MSCNHENLIWTISFMNDSVIISKDRGRPLKTVIDYVMSLILHFKDINDTQHHLSYLDLGSIYFSPFITQQKQRD